MPVILPLNLNEAGIIWWWYEKLPIAGDFLSSYTKDEAGYNP